MWVLKIRLPTAVLGIALAAVLAGGCVSSKRDHEYWANVRANQAGWEANEECPKSWQDHLWDVLLGRSSSDKK